MHSLYSTFILSISCWRFFFVFVFFGLIVLTQWTFIIILHSLFHQHYFSCTSNEYTLNRSLRLSTACFLLLSMLAFAFHVVAHSFGHSLPTGRHSVAAASWTVFIRYLCTYPQRHNSTEKKASKNDQFISLNTWRGGSRCHRQTYPLAAPHHRKHCPFTTRISFLPSRWTNREFKFLVRFVCVVRS